MSRQRRRIAVLGMPNTGKSTFFNRITGAQARIGNWPGLTVDLASAKILLGGDMVEVVDLPGIYTLHGFSDDEEVVHHFLEHESLNLLAVVLNSTQLERQLPLLLQLKSLGLPLILLLNMSDEARHLGIHIDASKLQAGLGFPILLISAKYGQGISRAKDIIREQLHQHPEARKASDSTLRHDDVIEAESARLIGQSVHIPMFLPARLTDKLDRYLLHPWIGLPLFFAIIFVVFQLVYGLGTPLQDGMEWLLDQFRTSLLEPLLASTLPGVKSFFIEGLFDGIGTVLTFLPIIVVFYILMAIVEDSGYLARAAFLMDAWMARMGLDGRTFVMQLMGMGCNVPALLGTRVMRSRRLRLLSMLIIPFSLCSARLQVLLFISTAIFDPKAAPIVLFSLYVLSFVIAFATALIWQGKFKSQEAMLLELPPYRMPTLGTLILQGWQSSMHFLKGASGFIVAGVVLIWFLTHYPFSAPPASAQTLAGQLAQFMAPVFEPIGINALLSVALLFGFVAKEIVIGGLAVIFSAGQTELSAVLASNMDSIQAYSFMLFLLIYTPCLSTVAVLKQESKSWSFTALAVFWPLSVAWLISFAFYQTARVLGI
jgi:ferrous iron transport protein B